MDPQPPTREQVPFIEDSIKPPKREKTLFLPSEYLTIGLVLIFVVVVFGGILFINSQSTPSSVDSSIPLASGTGVLSAQATPISVPDQIPQQQAILGPQAPTSKPKSTTTPKPSATPLPTASPTPTPTTTPTLNPTPSPTPSPTPTTATPTPTSSPTS